MKIKDLKHGGVLRGVKFLHPDTGEVCIWQSQWSYPDGGAGVWYKKDVINSTQLFAITLDKIEDSLELEVC